MKHFTADAASAPLCHNKANDADVIIDDATERPTTGRRRPVSLFGFRLPKLMERTEKERGQGRRYVEV